MTESQLKKKSFKLERILLAADDSFYSEGAIREAVALAHRFGAQLIFLSVLLVRQEEGHVIAKTTHVKHTESVHEHARLVKTLAEETGVPCEIVLRRGDEAAEVIAQTARSYQTDLIVMGRKDRLGIIRLVTGSVSARVIGETDGSVLIVPATAQLNFKKIVLATDGSPASDYATHCAIQLAHLTNAISLQVLLIGGDNPPAKWRQHAQEIMESVISQAEKKGVPATTIILSGKPAETITEYARSNQADLIIVGTNARKGLQKLLLGSVSEKIIINTPCSVWVAR